MLIIQEKNKADDLKVNMITSQIMHNLDKTIIS